MAQKSFLWTTGGAGDGASTYTRSDLSALFAVLSAVHAHEGVAPSYLNALAATIPAANTVRLNTGGAVVDGKGYVNDASLDINIPSAIGAGNTRIDRIVLRADWTAQTVRAIRIAGVDAATPTAPAITQSAGATYDITLYQVTVNTSGTVTVTADERTLGRIQTAGIADDAVTAAKIAAGAVNASEIGTGPVVGARRVGGDPTTWTVQGSTLYDISGLKLRVVMGLVDVTANNNTDGSVNIDVTAAGFSQAPMVVASPRGTSGWQLSAWASSNATTLIIGVQNNSGATRTVTVSFIAIGLVP